MKKIVGILLVLLFATASLSASDTKLFVVTRHISKIYIHRLGFRVVYLKTDLNLGSFYVPMSWFDEPGGKGILVKGNDPAFPFFSVFWDDGEFHSIRLYTHKNFSHESWGNLAHRDGMAELFDVDEIVVDF